MALRGSTKKQTQQKKLMRRCPDCQLDLDRYATPGSDRHRCVSKIAGARKATKLEAEKIARGEMSPADLLPKEKLAAAQSLGRLAPRHPADIRIRISPAGQPQPTPAELMEAISLHVPPLTGFAVALC
jgi:hypothetical protein